MQFSGTLPQGIIVEVTSPGNAAAPNPSISRQQNSRRHGIRWREIPEEVAQRNSIRWTDLPAHQGRRPIRWRDLPADPAPSGSRQGERPSGMVPPLTAEEELLAAHPEWEQLIPGRDRDFDEALEIIATLQLLPEERLAACRRYGYEGGLSLNIWRAIGALRTRLAGTAAADRRRPALEAALARLLEIEIRLNDVWIEGRALNGDQHALDIVALRGNIRRRQREIQEVNQGLRLPPEVTPPIALG